MESYKFSNQDDAINILQQMKKQGKNKKPIVFTIQYNNKFYCVRR